jgi:hypothetical protein
MMQFAVSFPLCWPAEGRAASESNEDGLVGIIRRRKDEQVGEVQAGSSPGNLRFAAL